MLKEEIFLAFFFCTVTLGLFTFFPLFYVLKVHPFLYSSLFSRIFHNYLGGSFVWVFSSLFCSLFWWCRKPLREDNDFLNGYNLGTYRVCCIAACRCLRSAWNWQFVCNGENMVVEKLLFGQFRFLLLVTEEGRQAIYVNSYSSQ